MSSINLNEHLYNEFIINNKEYERIEYHFQTIKKIDDIKVDARIEYEVNLDDDELIEFSYIKFIIDSRSIHDDTYEPINYYERVMLYKNKINIEYNEIDKILEDIKLLLIKLKFDKITSKFKTINVVEPFEDKYLDDELIDECCVCLDKTNMKTNCGHYLCVLCWDNLKNKDCPMCREEEIYAYDGE